MNILVATGGAAHSTVALTFGAHLAHLCNATLTALSVIKQETEQPRADAILSSARQVLERLLPEASFRTLTRVGHPAEEILAEAESGHYTLVVVGEKQHHGLITRFVLGSTAQRVIEHAPCPVLLAKGKIGPIQRILICDSGSDEVSIVERVTQQLPCFLDGPQGIAVLHVKSQGGVPEGEPGVATVKLIDGDSPEGKVLHRDLQLLGRNGYTCNPKVRHGPVVDEVLAEARERNYDLLVIGTHHGGGWRRILLDDNAHQIVMRLDRPVLVVR